jgi:hypothetical protein
MTTALRYSKSLFTIILWLSFNYIEAQDRLYFKGGIIKQGKIFSLLDEEIIWGHFDQNNLSADSINSAAFLKLDSILFEDGKKIKIDLLSIDPRKIKIPEIQQRRKSQESEYDNFRNNFHRPGLAGANLPIYYAVIYFRSRDSLNARVYDITDSHAYWYQTSLADVRNPLRFCQLWEIDSILFRCGEKRYFYNQLKPVPIDSVRNQSGTLVYLFEEDLLTDMGQSKFIPDLINSYEDGKADGHDLVVPKRNNSIEVASFFGGLIFVGFPVPMFASKKIGLTEGFNLAQNKIRYLRDPGYSEGFREQDQQFRTSQAC